MLNFKNTHGAEVDQGDEFVGIVKVTNYLLVGKSGKCFKEYFFSSNSRKFVSVANCIFSISEAVDRVRIA